MSSLRTLIAVSSALALTLLSACHVTKQASHEKPVVKYVNQDLTLEGYAEEKQTLEWRVHESQNYSFTFQPQQGLCDPATIHGRATNGHPASCVVALQPDLSGTQTKTYTYTLTSDSTTSAQVSGGIVPRAQAKPPTGGQAPAPPPVTYILRVGSCGGC
jgi:hypothetical protein